MTFEAWSFYLLTLLVFMLAPGPSHLLMLSTSLSNGFRRSLATAAGDLSANVVQMTLAGLGLAAVVTSSATVFLWVKWGGVVYLAWLGLRQLSISFRWRNPVAPAQPAGWRRLWLRGFITSAANPKAVVFFAALFPQFVDPGKDALTQLVILGLTYLAADSLFLASYGACAAWLGTRLQAAKRVWLDRAAGASLIGVAVLLGLRTVPNPD